MTTIGLGFVNVEETLERIFGSIQDAPIITKADFLKLTAKLYKFLKDAKETIIETPANPKDYVALLEKMAKFFAEKMQTSSETPQRLIFWTFLWLAVTNRVAGMKDHSDLLKIS